MYRYIAIVTAPLLRVIQRNARVRNRVDRILGRFPGLKLFLQSKLLYADNTRGARKKRILQTGAGQHRIYEELSRRIKADSP